LYLKEVLTKGEILKKMTSLKHCLTRLEEKWPEKWEAFLEDYDLQDIISLYSETPKSPFWW